MANNMSVTKTHRRCVKAPFRKKETKSNIVNQLPVSILK